MAQHAPILVAEDDDNDVFFLRHALQRAGLANPLIVTHDGQEAIEFLGGKHTGEEPHPALFLLDLKMPRLDGFDVLSWLSKRPDLKKFPIVVLSSSSHDLDKQRAQDLGAADYFVKPTEFLSLVDLVKRLQERWLHAA